MNHPYSASELYSILKKKFSSYTSSTNTYPDPTDHNNQIDYYIQNGPNIIGTPSYTLLHAFNRNSQTNPSTFFKTSEPVMSDTTLESIKSRLGISTPALKDTLMIINSEQGGWRKVLIPIDRPAIRFFGLLLAEPQFTLLEVNKDEQNNINVNYYDSKGMFNRIYSIATIRQAVEEVFGKNINFKSFYTGHQAMSDHVNSGRFIVCYIQDLLNGVSVTQSNSQNNSILFQEIDNMLL